MELDLEGADEREVRRGAYYMSSKLSQTAPALPMLNAPPPALTAALTAAKAPWHPRHLGRQVRRKADPAKALVKEWVSRWRDERTVTSEVSYKQINGDPCMPALYIGISLCLAGGT